MKKSNKTITNYFSYYINKILKRKFDSIINIERN